MVTGTFLASESAKNASHCPSGNSTIARPLVSVSGVRVSLTVSTLQRTSAAAVFRWSATDMLDYRATEYAEYAERRPRRATEYAEAAEHAERPGLFARAGLI